MDTRLAFILVAEINRQCRFALMAEETLKVALKNNDADNTWFSVQSLLISLANVSKILWPTKSNSRGEYLCRLLNVDESSVLASRKLRNHFEHIDERMETWYSMHGINKTSFDGGIAPSAGYTTTEGNTFFRWFDTALFAVTFCDELYHLDPMIEEAKSLYARTERAIEQLIAQDTQERRL